MVNSDVKSIAQKADEEIEAIEKKAAAEIQALNEEVDAAGDAEGIKRTQEFQQKLNTYCESFSENHRTQIVTAAHQYACSVFEHTIEEDSKLVVGVAKTVLKSIPEISNIWLRVNPQDIPILKSAMDQILEASGHHDPIELREDARLERGGVIVHSEAGVMDAQPKTQLAELKRLMGTQDQVEQQNKRLEA